MNWKQLAAVAALVATSVFVPLTPASAEEINEANYCVVALTAIDAPAEPTEPTCFNTESERDAYVSGASRLDAAAAASVVIGTVYRDEGYGGGSLTFTGSNGCAGVTYGFPSLNSDWANSISSAKATNGCWLTLYSAASYNGTRTNCTPSCPGVGALNDNVWSAVFRPSGTLGLL